MYSYLRERIKHIVRFRHKRGFGVHSPFMFNLILNVIRDKGKRFDYPLEEEVRQNLRHKELKFFRLIFRLLSFLGCRRVVCLGKVSETLPAYLSYVSNAIEFPADGVDKTDEVDFIVIGRDAKNVGLEFMRQRNQIRCIVIADIYKNGNNTRLWRLGKKEATVSIDMMWYGILFFDEKLQKGHYNLII